MDFWMFLGALHFAGLGRVFWRCCTLALGQCLKGRWRAVLALCRAWMLMPLAACSEAVRLFCFSVWLNRLFLPPE